MIRKLVVILAAAGVANGKMAPKSYVPPVALTVRGGAEPLETAVKTGSSLLDPNMVANVGMAIHLAQGVFCALAPAKSLEMYGIDDPPSGIHELTIERIGATLVSIFLTAYWLIVKDSSVAAAVGVGSLPFVVASTKSLLNGSANTLGYPVAGDLLILAIGVAVAYMGMTDSSNFGTALKAYGIWGVANGLLLGFIPEEGMKLWGHKSPAPIETMQIKVLGFWVLSLGTLLLALDQGVDPLKAFGYSWIPALILSIMLNFVTNETETFGMDKIPHYVWMAVELAIIGTLAVQG